VYFIAGYTMLHSSVVSDTVGELVVSGAASVGFLVGWKVGAGVEVVGSGGYSKHMALLLFTRSVKLVPEHEVQKVPGIWAIPFHIKVLYPGTPSLEHSGALSASLS
jgi:hypothetical protein